MGTKTNPGKFDCYAKAEPDEPVFVLLGRDPSAGPLVRLWAAIRMGNSSVAVETFMTMIRDCLHAPDLRAHIEPGEREDAKVLEAAQCGLDMSRYYFDKRDAEKAE